MHLYLLARANYPRLERWINDLLARYYPYEYDKGKMGSLQLSVRPIQMFEIVFPEPQYKEILETINPYGSRMAEIFKGRLNLLRRALKLEPVLKEEEINANDKMVRHSVDVAAIGIKKDNFLKGIEQI